MVSNNKKRMLIALEYAISTTDSCHLPKWVFFSHQKKKRVEYKDWFIWMMSNMNTNVRTLREKFQQEQEEKHQILFQCIHCGRHQTITLLTKGGYFGEVFCLRFVFKFYVQEHLEIWINAPVRRIYSRSYRNLTNQIKQDFIFNHLFRNWSTIISWFEFSTRK